MSIFRRKEEYVIVADETTKEAIVRFAISNSADREYGFAWGKGDLPVFKFESYREYRDIAEKLVRIFGKMYDVKIGERGTLFVMAKGA